MVFGWGKKKDIIEEKIESTEPINSEITLSEIPKIL